MFEEYPYAVRAIFYGPWPNDGEKHDMFWHFVYRTLKEALDNVKKAERMGGRAAIAQYNLATEKWELIYDSKQKGASKWEEETAAPSANMKDCTTSITKTCTSTHLAVKQHGKTWN